MNPADFRRSIEASLPPLTQYSISSGAPGLYGVFGWGSMQAGNRQLEAESNRASRASVDASTGVRASQDPDVERSASLRSLHNSFAQYAASEAPEARDTEQVQVNLNAAAGSTATTNSPVRHAEMLRPHVQQAPDRFPAVTSYPISFQHESQHAPAHFVSKPPTAPTPPPPASGGDGSVFVQANSPSRLYPQIPMQQGLTPRAAPREEPGSQHSPGRPTSSPGPQNAGDLSGDPNGPRPAPRTGSPFRQRPTQQPYTPQPMPGGVVQGRVFHMRRMEAWTKYIAYEGCLQVCTAELGGSNNMHAQYFLTDAFSVLRKGLGLDGLLLTQLANAPPTVSGADGCINDICWDDLEPPEKRLNTVAFTKSTATSYMRIRCQRLSVPNATMLQKLCCRTRSTMAINNFSGVRVHLAPSDDSCDTVTFQLDYHGGAINQSQAVVFPMDSAHHVSATPHVQPPQRLDILVDGPSGAVATGSIPYSKLLLAAGHQREPVDEAQAGSSAGTPVEVQVKGTGEFAGKTATVTVLVTHVRKDVARYEAQVAPDNTCVETVNKNTLRFNACLAYDAALVAALEATGCGRTRLLVEGAWEWLLRSFAAHFGVRSFYCLLAHLRWVLKPGIATISTMCLDVITSELRPLLDQSALRGLTTHETTLLEGVKKAVEMLLEVAFENYYALVDDQPRDGQGPESQSGQGTASWRPTVLMASFRLYRVMKDVFLPTDQDWLNTRFRIAAKKRWHFLECNSGFDQLRGDQQRPQTQTRGPNGPQLGHNINPHDSYYKQAEKMGLAIRSDLDFDLFLQKQPDLLPTTLNLPRITAEEYMANFVEILRNMLNRCPPMVPSVPAVDLLVATASLQRYLQETTLYMPQQHAGHLDAMELWRRHVLSWIESSRRGLCSHCGKLEAEAKLSVAHLARVDVAKMPGMIEGIEGAVAPLVHDMLDRTWAELMLYERVVKNWPLFGPHLEAALCDVLRTVQGSLNRICAGASNATMMQPGTTSHMRTAHVARRVPSVPHSGGPSNVHPTGGAAPSGPMHARGLSGGSYGVGSPGLGGGHGRTSPAAPMAPLHHGPNKPIGGPSSVGRNAVLVKEAVLLNSLKVLMVMVPSIEDIISKWCGGTSVAPPGPPPSAVPHAEFGDDLAPHIGAQFAQVVKELRTDYAEGVAACANRMANFIRSSPVTNIKIALNQPKPPAEVHAGYQPVSTMTQQREFVEAFMRPILAACDEALQALRAALDPRVFVATGRALWDCMGKDLFEFVHFLQESQDNKGAWRLRQHANIALTQLCEFFRGRLAASMEHCIGERDLDLPNNVDRAQKLLAHNTAVVNITLNPI